MAITGPYADTPEVGSPTGSVTPKQESALDPAANGSPDGASPGELAGDGAGSPEEDVAGEPGGDGVGEYDAAMEPWLYADKALAPNGDIIDLDALRFGAYADALAFLMDRETTYTPLTIAINGPWGSGKTSLARMTEDRLTEGSDWDLPHVVCKFDAWANDDAPHLGAAFGASVAKQLNGERLWRMRLLTPLPSSMLSPEERWRRRLWLIALSVLIAMAATLWPSGHTLLTPLLHHEVTIRTLKRGATATRLSFGLAVGVIVLAQKLWPTLQGVARWVDEPRSEAAQGTMQDAKAQLGRLIEQALRGKRRLMIFVDNLEFSSCCLVYYH